VVKRATNHSEKAETRVRRPPPHRPASTDAINLDPVIHERVRLGIISALAVNPALTFNDLKKLLEITDGNLSVHARKLEDAGYVLCTKSFVGRQPRTEFKLTTPGRRALESYLEQMECVIRSARQG
jgi:DNA-binding MarR family transcriptional regulator